MEIKKLRSLKVVSGYYVNRLDQLLSLLRVLFTAAEMGRMLTGTLPLASEKHHQSGDDEERNKKVRIRD